MQVFTTLHQLEPDPSFEALVPNTFRLKLKGVTGQYAGTALEMPRAETLLVYHTNRQGLAEALELIMAATFDDASAQKLQAHFALADAYAAGITSYCFRMKPETLARYGPDYVSTIELAAWLSFGEGAFLNLAHYDLVAYYRFDA